MVIRPHRQEDMPMLLEIWLQASLHAYDELPAALWWPHQEAMRDRFTAGSEIWVLEQAGQIKGFAALQADELLALYVHPEYQGSGLGAALLYQLKSCHPYLWLRVCSRNSDIITFYRHHGFTCCGEQKDPQTGLPELLMECPPRQAAPAAALG